MFYVGANKFYIITLDSFVLFSKIRTQVQVAFQPALLCHWEDGYEVSTKTPAGVSSIMPSLFVSRRFVAELSKLIPVRPWTSQLCMREEDDSESWSLKVNVVTQKSLF